MRKLFSRALALMTCLLVLPITLLRGQTGDSIVVVADTRKVHGWEAWWAKLYNGSHLTFAIVVVILVPIFGVLVSALANFVMARLGIRPKTSRTEGN
jgi:hypothetical protein